MIAGAKLAGYQALVTVRLTRPADAPAAFAESLSAAQPAPRQRAVVMLEAATAACQDGTARRDSDRADDQLRWPCRDGPHARIAIPGHRGLPGPTADLVDRAIRAALAGHAPDMTGISCLADGADQSSSPCGTASPRAYGGTAGVVAYAREHGTLARMIWPHGAERD